MKFSIVVLLIIKSDTSTCCALSHGTLPIAALKSEKKTALISKQPMNTSANIFQELVSISLKGPNLKWKVSRQQGVGVGENGFLGS